jgi:hypothetical protein
MQRKKWMEVGTMLEANLAAPVVPGNEILDSHGVFSLNLATSAADGTAAEVSLLMWRKSVC